MTRRTIVLALLLMGCTDSRDLTIPSFAILQPGCGAGQLIQAINAANAAPGSTIDLAAGCTYQLVAPHNFTSEHGANGLPIITRSMTINGNGATITRGALVPEFRFLYVLGRTAIVTLNDLTMSGGRASNSGGAVFNDQATLTLNRVKMTGNSASDWGGAVANVGGTMIIRNSKISANSSGDQGGGIVNVGGTLTIGSGTVVSGNHSEDGGGGVLNYGRPALNWLTVTDITKTRIVIDSSTISGNSSGDSGGGLVNDFGTVQISASRISGNLAGDAGGGVRNENGGALAIKTSTLSNNEALEAGGGLHNESATASVVRSTISGNTAKWGGGVGNESGGAGGNLSIRSSTISGNRAGEGGGGLFNDAGGRFTLAHTTISGNTALVKDGGGVLSYNDVNGLATVKSSIIAGNTPVDVAAVEAKTTFNSLGHNVVGRAGAYVDLNREFDATGDRTGVTDPKLGPLADNGGPTLTRVALAGSPVLNAGGGECPDTDQRGIKRPWGPACEIGAVEGSAPVTVTRLPTNGWDERSRRSLVEAGTLGVVTATDGISHEVDAGYSLTLAFEKIPSDSTVMSVTLHATHDGELGFTAGSALWQVGGGSLTSPFVAMETRPEQFGNTLTWDVTAWMRTATRVNGLKLMVHNLDPLGKKLLVDQAYLEVTYGPTRPKSTTAFPVTLFVTDGWDAKVGTTLAQTGRVSIVNGSDGNRAEVETGSFASYQFQRVPGNAVIQSVKVSVEHHEEVGFAAGGAVWRVAGGSLTSPTTRAQRSPPVLSGELNEGTEAWGVGGAFNTAALVNDLKFVVRNKDLGGKKTKIDRVYLVVTHKEL